MAGDVKYTSYSQFISNIDPCKEEEACLLRSGLIYPQNPALVRKKSSDSKPNSVDSESSHKRFLCYHCGSWYDSRDSLRRHLNFRHLRDFGKIDDVNTRRWHCKKCRKEFGCKPTDNGSGDKVITHFCKDSVLKKDALNKPNDLRLCLDDGSRSVLKIKRIRFESRIHTEMSAVEQWLKYELLRTELKRSDYLNAAKMFIAVKGYEKAIGLLNKSIEIYKDKDHGAEQILIDVANEMIKKSKHKK